MTQDVLSIFNYLINDFKPKNPPTINTKIITSWSPLFSHSSGWEAVWEFPQSLSHRDDEPQWVRWLQTPPVLQLRVRDRRSGSGRGRWGEEEKEGQLAQPIRTLLHHRCKALRGVRFPQPPHLLHSQYLLLNRLPILCILDTPKQAGLGPQQWIRSRAWWRSGREGAGSHGCLRWHSEVAVTAQEWEFAKQQRPHSHGVRWDTINAWH